MAGSEETRNLDLPCMTNSNSMSGVCGIYIYIYTTATTAPMAIGDCRAREGSGRRPSTYSTTTTSAGLDRTIYSGLEI